ncbi:MULTISPECIES: hypothetical protein [unclassified Rathayibacter]|uniref:hypothetical protein n=1 Tax=unclassified Rathayibacter TaxID=2609250 RepID=UPI001061DACB|nr:MULTISPECIES: hypothetical protein [unclassified Rathayibacter]
MIAETLHALGVTRVIVIDDEVDAAEAENALLRVRSDISAARKVLVDLAGAYPDSDLTDIRGELLHNDDELRDALTALWGDLQDEERHRLQDATRGVETPYLNRIAHYLPKDVTFLPQGARGWHSESYLSLFEENTPTLVFFDQNLTDAGLGEKGGERLLRDLKSHNFASVFCGLLTQEVRNLESESEASSRLGTADEAVPVLGKFRLDSAKQFALGMQAFILAHDLHRLRSHVLDATAVAFTAALSTTGNLAYVTLLAAARSAYGEGLYEGSGVARMMSTALRRNVETALVSNVPKEAVNRIRQVMDIELDLGHPDPAEVGPVEDAFENAEHLCAALSPTDVGDIYEFSGANGASMLYILLAQPCDLQVRSRGARDNASSGYFVLARLIQEGEPIPPRGDDEEDIDSDYHDAPRTLSVGILPGRAGNWKINLADRAFMPPELLDACVLNFDGTSRIPTGVPDEDIPTQSWAKWRKKVDAWGIRKVDSARQAYRQFPGSQLKIEHRQAVVDLVVKGDLGRQFVDGKVSINASVDSNDKGKNHELVAGIRRVGRLSAAHAKALLIQYSHFHTRPDLPQSLLKAVDPRKAKVPKTLQ